MELTIERTDVARDCKYMEGVHECKPFVIRESGSMDHACAIILLRNLGEKKDITSLERDALSAAIRALQCDTGAGKM